MPTTSHNSCAQAITVLPPVAAVLHSAQQGWQHVNRSGTRTSSTNHLVGTQPLSYPPSSQKEVPVGPVEQPHRHPPSPSILPPARSGHHPHTRPSWPTPIHHEVDPHTDQRRPTQTHQRPNRTSKPVQPYTNPPAPWTLLISAAIAALRPKSGCSTAEPKGCPVTGLTSLSRIQSFMASRW